MLTTTDPGAAAATSNLMLHLALNDLIGMTVYVSVCVSFVGMKEIYVPPSDAHTRGRVCVNSLNTGTNWHQFLSVKATKGDDTPSTPLRLKSHRTQRDETHPVFLARHPAQCNTG